MITLEGKTALVTGAARGQGEAAARLFVRLGARVVLADVLDEAGEKVAAELGENARYVHLDVTDEEQWAAAAETAVSAFGGLDVLVNNAGVFRSQRIEDESKDAFVRTLQVNLVGPFLGIQAVTGPMRRAGGGSIVNVSSVSGLKGVGGSASYGSSKWGLRGLSKTAALELGEFGIRVNSIHPGIIATPMNEGMAPPVGAGNHPGVALRRVGLPQDVVGLVAFLASDASVYLTGAEIAIDGGFSAGPTPPVSTPSA
ncbi:glucose 1-dehydrogenase [Kitasatospora sp. NPDC036755]|uniref:glucose 1-dehydrogenase n=1 Tax=Kitasatospora sp. NPDC036755 TaxID=3154600 RepID=UPI0033DF8E67